MIDLTGRKVLVTRSVEDSVLLIERLEAAGAATLLMPCISTRFYDDAETRERIADEIESAQWIVFTSARGVEAVGRMGLAPEAGTLIAAVGESTAVKARQWSGRCELVTSGGGATLARQLLGVIEGHSLAGPVRVVIPMAESGRLDVEQILTAGGVEAVRIPVYDSTPVEEISPKADLAGGGVDTVVLASPSAARGLLNQAVVADSIRIVTLGPTTSEAVREVGLTVAAEASRPSLDALIEAIK